MRKTVNIGGKIIGENQPHYIIAEIGINHNGSLETAKKIIDNAVYCGADAVKFQKRTVSEFILNNNQLHGNKVLAYITPHVKEVDVAEDFSYLLYQINHHKEMFSRLFDVQSNS